MKQGINLIKEQSGKRFSFLRHKRKINLIIFGLFALFIILSGFVLTTIYVLNQNFKQNEKKTALLRGQIKSLEKNESYAVIVANRISLINTLLKSRKSYAETISSLKFLLIPNFQLSGLELASTGGLKLNGTCKDLQSLTKFYEITEQLKLNPKYSGLILSRVNKDIGSGEYDLTMTLF